MERKIVHEEVYQGIKIIVDAKFMQTYSYTQGKSVDAVGLNCFTSIFNEEAYKNAIQEKLENPLQPDVKVEDFYFSNFDSIYKEVYREDWIKKWFFFKEPNLKSFKEEVIEKVNLMVVERKDEIDLNNRNERINEGLLDSLDNLDEY